MLKSMNAANCVRSALVLALFGSTAGCYSYARVSPTAVTPGSRVAVELTPRAAADNEARFGTMVDRVEGVLLGSSGDTARIEVRRARTLGGGWSYWARESMNVPISASTYWGKRAFSTRKSLISAAVLVGLGVQIYSNGLFGLGGHNPDPEPKPIPPVQPGLRWRF
jgi:hypothetical protein